MDNFALFSGVYNPFINQDEVKEKQEADVKEQPLPFDIIKTVFANLNRETVLIQAELREKITRVLTDLSNDDQSILETYKLPTKDNDPLLHKTLFQFVNLYKQIKIANEKLVNHEKNDMLLEISRNLLKLGDLDKAIEIASSIGCLTLKSVSFREISCFLVKTNCLDKAVDLMNIMPETAAKIVSLDEICAALVINGKTEKAFTLSQRVVSANSRAFILLGMSKALELIGNIERSVSVAKLAENNINLAILHVHSLPNASLKGRSLAAIVKTVIKAGNIVWAIEIANNINEHEHESRDNAFGNIALYFGRIGNIEQAVNFVGRIVEGDTYFIFMHIFDSNINNIGEFVRVAKTLSDNNFREIILSEVIRKILLQINALSVAKAQEIVNGETDTTVKPNLQAIIDSFLIRGQEGG